MLFVGVPGTLRCLLFLWLFVASPVVSGKQSGLNVRAFKGFASLQEVECSAGHMGSEVKLLSLKLYRAADDAMLAYLNTLTNECITFVEYSSCDLDTADTRKSRLRVLVSDLAEGESRRYGCKANNFRSTEEAKLSTWIIDVIRNRLSVQNFKGFPSLQEVECWGGHLPTDVKLVSLKLLTLGEDGEVLAYLNTLSNECITHKDYSSCRIDTATSRRSRLRVLVSDLEEGQKRGYGCRAGIFRSGEEPRTESWSIVVERVRMSVRIFKGFPSLQEVECTTKSLKPEVKVFSLKLFKQLGEEMLAHANPMTNECITFGEFSSCTIDESDTRNSRLRVLVSDLEPGQSRRFGCKASSFGPYGEYDAAVWSIAVTREREWWILLLSLRIWLLS